MYHKGMQTLLLGKRDEEKRTYFSVRLWDALQNGSPDVGYVEECYLCEFGKEENRMIIKRNVKIHSEIKTAPFTLPVMFESQQVNFCSVFDGPFCRSSLRIVCVYFNSKLDNAYYLVYFHNAKYVLSNKIMSNIYIYIRIY